MAIDATPTRHEKMSDSLAIEEMRACASDLEDLDFDDDERIEFPELMLYIFSTEENLSRELKLKRSYNYVLWKIIRFSRSIYAIAENLYSESELIIPKWKTYIICSCRT